jgi:glycosyltransferase involved in cell wall biosynthesis
MKSIDINFMNNTSKADQVRVLHVFSTLNKELGGSILIAIELACQLSAYSTVISNEVFSLGNSKETLRSNEDLVQTLRTRNIPLHIGLSKRANRYGFTKIRSIFKNSIHMIKVDVVVCHQIYTVGTFYSSIICWVFRIPLIIIPHGSLTAYHTSIRARRKNFIKPFISAILRRAHTIITNSEQERFDLEKNFKVCSQIIPYGANERISEVTKGTSSNSFNFVFVGRFTRKKQIPLIINSFLKLHEKYNDVHLTIVGDGEERIRKEVTEVVGPRKTDAIELTGWVNSTRLEEIYLKSNCLVLPSLDENFGLVVTEALSYSIPCIVSKDVGVSNYISEYQAGVVLEVTDEDHLIDAMQAVYLADYTSLSEAAKNVFQNELNWTSIISKWEKVLTLK